MNYKAITILIYIAILTVTLSGCRTLGPSETMPQIDPNHPVVITFYTIQSSLHNHDYKTAWQLLSKKMQAVIGSYETYEAFYQTEKFSPRWEVVDLTMEGKHAVIKTDVDSEYPCAAPGPRLHFVKEYGIWKLTHQLRQGTDIYLFDLSTSSEIPLCTAEGDQKAPSIHGDKVVWQDGRNIWDVFTRRGRRNYDIYMYDLKTSTERKIAANPYPQYCPDISENIIVWSDERDYPTSPRIFVFDLVQRKETKLLDLQACEPHIDAGKVVYIRIERGRALCVSDITTGKIMHIPIQNEWPETPRISMDKVVWHDSYSADIYLFDLHTGELLTIFSDEIATAAWPDTYGNFIVWNDNRRGNSDIYLYDLTKKKEYMICKARGNQALAKIHENRIVWEDKRHGNSNIYMYDLATKQEMAICTQPNDQHEVAIYGDKIVWTDTRNRRQYW